jgi:tripeptide aminopeptidase
MVNQERLKNLLLELLQIDSLSRKEGQVAARLKAICEEIGCEVEVDDAGAKVGGDTGNVIARLKGTNSSAPPILLSAHMDTVGPGEGVKPIVEGDIIRTDGTTVLGGDDKSGIAIIIELLRCLQEQNVPHPDIEVVFTVCEEVGLLGSKYVDVSKLKARYGLVLDSDDPGFLFTRGPATNHIEVVIRGLEAHAGIAPEEGISAIQVAGEALSQMKLGRIDHETTANIGLIGGGIAFNVVPNEVWLKCEARSIDIDKLTAQTEHMVRCFKDAVAQHTVTVGGKTTTARAEIEVTRQYERLYLSDDEAIVRLVKQAASNLGFQCKTMAFGGGCDANIFSSRDISVANLGTGMRAIHTVNEWVDVKDLYKGADIMMEILRLAGQTKS